MHFLFCLAYCSRAAEGFYSHFRLQGNRGGRRYISVHVGILAELRSGALGNRRRFIFSLVEDDDAVLCVYM